MVSIETKIAKHTDKILKLARKADARIAELEAALESQPPAWRTPFGACVNTNQGESYADALARVEAMYGRLPVVRKFFQGLPTSSLGVVGREVHVSFKAKPQDILDGVHDGYLRGWFAAMESVPGLYWTYYHEPEDDIEHGEFTAEQYRDAFAHIDSLATTGSSTLCLMAWSLNKASGRNWQDYYPLINIDVLSWDAYNQGAKRGVYDSPEKVFGPAVEASKVAGHPFAIAEWGSLLVAGDSGVNRAAWMRDCGAYLREQEALYATYFDSPVGGEYRLLDKPSQQALAALVASS